ncbi:MAG: MmcQ/YjbR family DNA-binding protein [Clostridiales bacterium]|nr:MmcQ/YjbR family DNA-binding protein [Clostridiales bacterium]MDO4350099.1 MmcQ/YjbR family DNA-binding protein [Eubacteriales bacterium]MDY4009420.1 MmcQ/YjbR family DNA-binding protein [Candidatus Limiplasma sp.]
MNTSWLDEALKAHPGVTMDYKAEWGWERYMVGGKMFAATCCPGPEHAAPYAGHPLLNLKCDPLESELLRAQYPDILPGFYSDKRNWISVRLDGGVPQPLVHELCGKAYTLIFQKLTKKLQREIEGAQG